MVGISRELRVGEFVTDFELGLADVKGIFRRPLEFIRAVMIAV